MNARFDLTGRTVIITGGGKGIGKVYSEEFAKAGAQVVAADIDGAAAKSVAEALAAEGLNAAVLPSTSAAKNRLPPWQRLRSSGSAPSTC
jgi:NAD(P)-dependent dehydrogenase (short-subunit alcohol dehydrogenase family)